MLLGGFLTLWIGPTVPAPAPPMLLDFLEQVSVSHADSGRSGFQLSFKVGRDRQLGVVDYPPLLTQMLRIGHRVLVIVTLTAQPTMLMDGIITSIQLSPSSDTNGSRVTVTGEDISAMMDLIEINQAFPPGSTDVAIVSMLLGRYAGYNVVPDVRGLAMIPGANQPHTPIDAAPSYNGTDRKIIEEIAKKHECTFYIDPLTAPLVNRAWVGPPERIGVPQRALTFNMGPLSNVNSIQFSADGNKPAGVVGFHQPTRLSPQSPPMPPVPLLGLPFAVPPLAAMPAAVANAPYVRVRLPQGDHKGDVVAATMAATLAAQASTRDAMTASGELDVGRYGGVLRPRAIVGVRGVGLTHDGFWYVKSTSSTISRGSFKQSFTLERDGNFPISPVVPP